jgi:Protein of unknown function (DUF1501)
MNRRELFQSLSCGFGSIALAGISAQQASANSAGPLAPRPPHFRARAKRVIFLFMEGGPSQHETFDYNPELARAGGSNNMMAPAFEFKPAGQSGLPIAEIFPNLARHADDLCLLNGMNTDSAVHAQGQIQLHTGSFNFVRPSMGAWVVYGLGTENQDLPGYISFNPRGLGGARNYGSAFLPASFQGTPYQSAAGRLPNITNPTLSRDDQRKQIDLTQWLNQDYLRRATADAELEGVIQSLEMAFRMQTSVPGVLDIEGESESTRKRYGLDSPVTRGFGTQCLLARRLAEAGVRFIELAHGSWDHHNALRTRIQQTARETDQPIAALLEDLKQRSLLNDTLVVWGGEFGRTTTGQNGDGRNHNNRGYTMWLAGGGIKGGMRYGSTDAITGSAISGKVHLHDLHATVLNQLGLDHTRLTYRYGGRDFRLTDVAGNVVREIL